MPSRNRDATLLIVCLLICFGVWRWANHLLIPANTARALGKGTPIGNNSDLYPRWLGARELFTHHLDPYSTEVTRKIQQGFYGRPLDPSKPADPTDQAAFAYPVYVVFLLAPSVTLPFTVVQQIFRWLLIFGIAASVPLWLRALGVHARIVVIASAILLIMSCYPTILEFYMQNFSALVAFLLALAAAAVVEGWLILGGFLLSLATIKPQLSVFFILWFLLWAFGDWRARKRLVLSFAITLLTLFFAGEWLLPGWISEFLSGIRRYRDYTANPSTLGMFFPGPVALLVAIALLAVFIWLAWHLRKSPAPSTGFGWMLAWSAVTTLMFVPTSVYNQVVLVPALLALFAHREKIWRSNRVPRAVTKAVLACLIWQWATAALLGWLSLLPGTTWLMRAAYVPLWTLLALPAVTLVALAGTTSVVGES